MDTSPTLKAVAEVEVPVTVTLAETSLSLEEILALRPGSTLTFAHRADDPLTLEVDGVPVGRGRAVERNGRLGLAIDSSTGA